MSASNPFAWPWLAFDGGEGLAAPRGPRMRGPWSNSCCGRKNLRSGGRLASTSSAKTAIRRRSANWRKRSAPPRARGPSSPAETSSFMETLLPMLGLAAHARDHPSAGLSRAVDRASEVFLRRKLFRRATNGAIIHADFVTLHYPRYWHYDILGGLTAMARLGKIRDPRCEEALDLLEAKRLPDGGWPAERRFYKVRPRTFEANSDYVDWGGTGAHRMNEWVTADALAVLRSAGRLDL